MTNFSSLTLIEIKLRFGQDLVKLLDFLAPLKDLIYLCLAIDLKKMLIFPTIWIFQSTTLPVTPKSFNYFQSKC